FGPTAMDFTDHGAGTLSWGTATADVGTYQVRIRVNDNNGGTADQVFILSVLSPSQTNFPPVFTSTPVVVATVNDPSKPASAPGYTYQATATDQDADYPLAWSVQSGPAGLTINPATGLVTWRPTDTQLGAQSVTLKVTDGHGASTTQTFTVWVQETPGNH